MEFCIDTGSRIPIYRQLVEQIREAAARGQLRAGERLPSVRALSRTMVVNPNTVARAYTELERDGVLNTRPGLGVFVAVPKAVLTKRVRRERLVAGLDRFLTEAVHLGFSQNEVSELVQNRISEFRWND